MLMLWYAATMRTSMGFYTPPWALSQRRIASIHGHSRPSPLKMPVIGSQVSGGIYVESKRP